jgi:hypothetical protein
MAREKRLTTKTARRHTRRVTPAVAAEAADIPIIDVRPGGTLVVVVDVGPMVIPYTVAYAGTTVIKSLVDRAERVPLREGDFILAWSFAHAVKEWTHRIGYAVDGGEVILLESRSEANKDPDHSVGFALVHAAEER